ncbi:hypothetical protein HanIR_Chr10g0470371 [Helianthus annuus]|nr:hypothetical protein HanIR_Chr10g0470371 [Helianthus annuus]
MPELKPPLKFYNVFGRLLNIEVEFSVQCTSGLPGDFTIEIGETSFHLHKEFETDLIMLNGTLSDIHILLLKVGMVYLG